MSRYLCTPCHDILKVTLINFRGLYMSKHRISDSVKASFQQLTKAASILSTIPILAISLQSFGQSPKRAGLSPAATECFAEVMKSSDVLSANSKYKNMTEKENLAVKLCTYSDAPGALKCMFQADHTDQILPFAKRVSNAVILEQKYVELCQNSRILYTSARTGEMDSIECFKGIVSDQSILVNSRNEMTGFQFERLAVRFCINSNFAGAKACFEKAAAKESGILNSNKDFKAATAMEAKIVELCRASRKR